MRVSIFVALRRIKCYFICVRWKETSARRLRVLPPRKNRYARRTLCDRIYVQPIGRVREKLPLQRQHNFLKAYSELLENIIRVVQLQSL